MGFVNRKEGIATSLQIPEERMHTFALLNLIAPSTTSSSDYDLYGTLASALASGNLQNLLAVIMPQFAYKKGQLYLASRSVEDIFLMRGLNIDMKWALPFKSKIDQRESCPLMYDGRLVVPTQTKECDWVFKNTPIMQGRTELAEMLPSSKMKTVEDVSATALPRSTDIDGAVKGRRSMRSSAWTHSRSLWMR